LVSAKQARQFNVAATSLGIHRFFTDERVILTGEVRSDFLARLDRFRPTAFRRGVVMPNRYNLRVFYGVEEMLSSFVGSSFNIENADKYVFGFDPSNDSQTLDQRYQSQCALLLENGLVISNILSSLFSNVDCVNSWPNNVFAVEENLTKGIIFDEFAGTPFIAGSDDKRIFEVATW
jgi:hypothetical protein